MGDIETGAAKRESFDAYSLIIGFTGSPGSGCSFLAEGIVSVLGGRDGRRHGHYYKVSDFLRQEAKRRSLPETVANLQTLGDEFRRKEGLSVLVEKCLEQVKEDDRIANFSQDEETVILIDGIKNEGEVKYLRQFANFYLVSVHADRDTREARLVGDSVPDRRFNTHEEFVTADRRDEEEEIVNGQQIKRCNYLADIIVINDKKLTTGRQKTEIYQRFVDDYIYPMRKVRKGERPHERPPRVEETLMTMAYCASKRSSCLKRKVGAVIAYVRSIEDEYPDAHIDEATDRDIPFQVVSVGYNDIPLGTPCVFSEWKTCYREYLQEERAKALKNCWNCGELLPVSIKCAHCGSENASRSLRCSECDSDLLADYACQRCGHRVFSICLPGEEGMPGKLLDMCRALHAEESAILGLAGISKGGHGQLVLYTTTFPCNLCANKIVAAGIRRVYYAEPYTKKESEELLQRCGVKTTRFEGIKSTAYFRLYV
jgi:deoxycytidylate deaminase